MLIYHKGEESGMVVWTEVEIFVGLFCASAAVFKSVIQRHAPKLLGIGGSGLDISEGSSKIGLQPITSTPLKSSKSFTEPTFPKINNVDDIESLPPRPKVNELESAPETHTVVSSAHRHALSTDFISEVPDSVFEFDFEFDDTKPEKPVIQGNEAHELDGIRDERRNTSSTGRYTFYISSSPELRPESPTFKF
jgi:hypothetical protein